VTQTLPGSAPELADKVTSIETALTHGGHLLDPAAVERARTTLERTGERLRLGAQHTVVALVGATGSGKSSLFNALAGMEISEVGVRRPTTSDAKACVWGSVGADPLLDWLGISPDHRTGRESVLDADRESALHGLVLIDLPDHDSGEVGHRLVVDRLVELVDLLVWVVDPQKYADEALHSGYLKRMAGHDGVMIVVLNQIDRLSDVEAEACRNDLRRLLDSDGLQAVQLLTTSARRGDGIETIRSVLADVVRRRAAVAARAEADLTATATELARGVASDGSVGRLPGTEDLIAALASAAGVPGMLDSVEADYQRQAIRATGWPFLRWLRRLRPDALARLQLDPASEDDVRRLTRPNVPGATPAQRGRVELAVHQVTAAAAERLPTRWADAVRQAAAAAAEGDGLSEALDQAVAGVDLDLKPPPWWRMVFAAHLLLAVLTVVGFVWLAVMGVSTLIKPGSMDPLRLAGFPLPTLMFVLGLALGLLLALVAVLLARGGATRRRARIAGELHGEVGQVARARVIDPVAAVLEGHRITAEALVSAR
jgi:GTPase Era involved in 16S rRNA processing